MIREARWIAPAGAESHKPCHFRAEKVLDLPSVPERLMVRLTCDGNYLLTVNGRSVGRGPARGTRSVAFFDEYDAAPFLHPGRNVFSVLSVCMNYPALVSQPITPAVRRAIGDLAASDRTWTTYLCTAEWPECAPVFTPQSGFAEWRDLRCANAPEPAETALPPQKKRARS